MRRRLAAANGDVYTLRELIVPSVGISVSFQYNSINQLLKSANDDHIADDHFLRQHRWTTILFASNFAVQYVPLLQDIIAQMP